MALQSLVDLVGETVLIARESGEGCGTEEAISGTPFGSSEQIGATTHRTDKEEQQRRGGIEDGRGGQGDEEDGEEEDDHQLSRGSLGDIAKEGYSLVSKDGVVLEVVNTEEITGPEIVVGLYFTASTLADCSKMTSLLLSLQEALNRSSSTSEGCCRLKVIVVSGDEAFYRYSLANTPFFAVPFHYHHIRRALCRRYRVPSLPTLVLLDSRTTRLISRPSIEFLENDPEGLKFPWRPRPLKEILGSLELVNTLGQTIEYSSFKDSYKALYFSAHWCPPCKVFGPQLVQCVQNIQAAGHKLQVVLVSSDRSEESFQTNQSALNYPSVPWNKELDRRELAAALQVEGIPSLVLLAPDDTVVTYEGRAHVNRSPEGKAFPWVDQSVEVLAERHMCTLLERPCLIIFADAESGPGVEHYRELLLPVAEEYLLHRSHGPMDGATVAFLVAGESEICDSMREASGVEDVAPLVCMLDLAENVKYIMEDELLNTATLHLFLTRYQRQELTPLPIMTQFPPQSCPEESL